jgi:molecular chaperone DnaJ
VLGVPRDAEPKAIKDAFRQLALKFHPDRNKEPGAEERFKQIAEAYAVLSDPKKRADYDARGFAGVAGFTPEDLFGGINFDDLFGGLGFDLGGPSMFERFFRRRRPAGPPRGENVEVELVVPLTKIASGGPEKVRLAHPMPCPECHGSGAAPGTSPRVCEICKGTGRKVTSQRKEGIFLQQATICPSCHGRGSFIDQPCGKCAGSGRSASEEALEVDIPPGIDEGVLLRVPGHGLPASEASGTPGDLFVRVASAPDARFVRDGADLWHAETIDVADAVLGISLRVPSLDKAATVTVPPGTQPDAVLRLRGKGLPRFGGKGRGDLLLRIAVRVPEHPSAEERALYERLRTLTRNS